MKVFDQFSMSIDNMDGRITHELESDNKVEPKYQKIRESLTSQFYSKDKRFRRKVDKYDYNMKD